MIFETSWDDGSKYDLKLIELLKKYDMPAVFYIPIRCDIGMFMVKEISKEYEIGCHTYSHPMDMKLLNAEELHVEVKVARELLQIATEQEITKFCYPRGRYSPFVRDLVKQAGFTEARTTKVLTITSDFDPFEKPTSIHAYQRKEYEKVDWLEVAKKTYDDAQVGGYFHLWGHSAEIQKNDDWRRLESFFKYVRDNKSKN